MFVVTATMELVFWRFFFNSKIAEKHIETAKEIEGVVLPVENWELKGKQLLSNQMKCTHLLKGFVFLKRAKTQGILYFRLVFAQDITFR